MDREIEVAYCIKDWHKQNVTIAAGSVFFYGLSKNGVFLLYGFYKGKTNVIDMVHAHRGEFNEYFRPYTILKKCQFCKHSRFEVCELVCTNGFCHYEREGKE